MDNLLNELNNGTVEYVDGGIMRTNPPTLLALRSARTIKNLIDQVNNAVNTSNQLSLQYNELFSNYQQLKEKLDDATRNVRPDANVESVCESTDSGRQEATDEVSDVGSGDGDTGSSDSVSEGLGEEPQSNSSIG